MSSLTEFSAADVCTNPQCVSMCAPLHALGGVTHGPKNGSQWTQSFSGQVPVDSESKKEKDDEGWWRLADGIQQG